MKNKISAGIAIMFLLVTVAAFAANFTDDQLQFGKPGSSANKEIVFGASNKKKLKHVPGTLTLDYEGNNLSVGDGLNTSDKTLKLNKGVNSPTLRHNFTSGDLEIENAPVLNQKGNSVSVGDGTNTNKVLKFNKGASSPEIRYNSTTGKLQFTNDTTTYKDIGSGSGAGGGINLLQNNPDFEGGVTTDWVSSTATVTSQSYATPSGDNLKFARIVSTSGYYETATVSMPTFLQNGDCELNFNYTQSTSGNYRVDVFTSGTVVASQTIASATAWVAGPKIFFPCGTTNTKVRFTALASATIDIDDVYLGQLRSSKSGAIVGAWIPYSVTSIQGLGTLVTTSFQYRVLGNSLHIQATWQNGTVNGSQIQIPLPPGYTASSAYSSGFNHLVGTLARNQAGAAAFYVLASQNSSVLFASSQAAGSGGLTTQTGTAAFSNGDTLSMNVLVTVNGISGTGTSFDSACPNDIACEDTFSFKVSTTGVVTEEVLDIVNGNCGVVGNTFTCTWNTGVFPTGVSCTGTENGGGGNQSTSTAGGTSTNLIYATTLNGAATALATTWVCRRNDNVAKKTIEGFLSKTVTSTGLFLERIERVRAGGAATDTTNCTASPCTIHRQSGGIASVTRGGTGLYNVNFVAGTFSQTPSCTGASYNNTIGQMVTPLGGGSASTFPFASVAQNGPNSDSWFDIVCVGPR